MLSKVKHQGGMELGSAATNRLAGHGAMTTAWGSTPERRQR